MASCLKKSAGAIQTFSKYVQIRRITRSITALNLSVPQPDGEPKKITPRIEEMANNIAKLSLIEVAELTEVLKKKLNLPDVPAMGFAGVVAQPAEQKGEEEEAQAAAAQTSFTVKLTAFDEKQKVALIKEIKNSLEGMNLVQAKKFVESVPVIVKQDIGKDEADKLKEVLTKVGATVEIL